MWKCPECDHEIEYLDFTAQTQGWESGSVTLSTEYQEESDRIEDYDYSDSGTDETNDYEYRCSECEMHVNLDDLIWEDDGIPKVYEHIPCFQCVGAKTKCEHKISYCKHCKYNKTPPEPEIEEEKHKIISPKHNIIVDSKPKATEEDGMICQNKKCCYVFVYQSNHNSEKEEFFECPKCETVNSKMKYLKTLETRK